MPCALDGWLLFLDESGHDHNQMPYEVRGGVALHVSKLWPFARAVQQPELDAFGAEVMQQEQEITEPAWCRKIGRELPERRVEREPFSLKLLDAIDKSAATLCDCYSHLSPEPLWVPALAA